MKMLPCFAVDNVSNVSRCDSKISSKTRVHAVFFFRRIPAFKNLNNLVFRQFACIYHFAFCVTIFCHSVIMILFWCTKKKMIWIAAQWRIACMAYRHSFWYFFSSNKGNHKTMNAPGFSFCKNAPISIRDYVSLPNKALTYFFCFCKNLTDFHFVFTLKNLIVYHFQLPKQDYAA